MYIELLSLNNFRNYERLELPLGPGVNILYGDNAQGKTNILESIFLGATTKSQRGSKDREMIRFGTDQAHIRIQYVRDNLHHKIDLQLTRGRSKGAAVDHVPVKRSGDFIGHIHVISFSPEDLSIIKDGPAARRKFLNMEMCQLDSVYLHDLTLYNRVVSQRNNLLKEITFHPSLESTLDVWDEQLLRYGRSIISARQQFLQKLGTWVSSIHERLTHGAEHLVVKYSPYVAPEDFEQKLSAMRSTDLKFHTTCCGPHRDDFLFLINDVDVRHFGSQGQQRTAALSLKLSEIELVREWIGDDPILLLDDVFSELDSSRQESLIDCIKDVQTVVSCTGMDEFIEKRLPVDNIYNVTAGCVTKQEDLHE